MTETLKSNLLATEGEVKKKKKGKGGKKEPSSVNSGSGEDRIELSSPETWETVPLIAPADLIVSRTGLNLTFYFACVAYRFPEADPSGVWVDRIVSSQLAQVLSPVVQTKTSTNKTTA